ncbi:MAG: hypothetical protein K2I30_04530 [Clostridia bacterium]|nr:hypothetical protein [Clostridia bacterium]
MANEIAKLKPLQEPGEVIESETDAKYEVYKADGLYEYSLQANGKPNKAHARITYTHGDIYDGNLKHGKYSGLGSYQWKDGGFYEGNFSGGKLNGTGKYAAPNGDVYEGNFKNNKYNGEGKYTWEDGSSFEGTFKNGQMQSGRYIDADGNVYDCKFTYKLNGERKNGSIRLVRFAEKEPPKNENTEKKETKEKKENKVSKEAKETSKDADKDAPKNDKAETKKAAVSRVNKNGLTSKDTKLITIIRNSKRGAEFKNLYTGASGKSERAEKDLIAILNFFTNSDAAQIQRIFKSSKIYDASKGDERLTDMVTGIIKRSNDFVHSTKSAATGRQSSASAVNGAAR